MIDFRSDNTGRVAPEILDALIAANSGTALGYGGDDWTAALQERFSELFETKVRVFPVATGTAANALSLAALSPSWGLVFCSALAHINTSETNAAGFFGGGLKLVPVAGRDGRIDADELARSLAAFQPGQTHRGQRGFRGEVQRHQAKRIFTSLPSSARMAWSGVLNPRHLRGVRLAVRMISWMS